MVKQVTDRMFKWPASLAAQMSGDDGWYHRKRPVCGRCNNVAFEFNTILNAEMECILFPSTAAKCSDDSIKLTFRERDFDQAEAGRAGLHSYYVEMRAETVIRT